MPKDKHAKKHLIQLKDGEKHTFFVSDQRYDKVKLNYKRKKLELYNDSIIAEALSL